MYIYLSYENNGKIPLNSPSLINVSLHQILVLNSMHWTKGRITSIVFQLKDCVWAVVTMIKSTTKNQSYDDHMSKHTKVTYTKCL